ncbi:nucleotidyltransferase domain-containing protein [Murdochiella vaginalis]|uniref:nucleotidyltransferase domain-containing protein n=1 Tax=Murdochiella vaginalis TaxID=1852373 RepID=UPI0008FE3CD8|nr:nucleotidyltransferase domain-containing protein [Murdochiella vaginalis]
MDHQQKIIAYLKENYDPLTIAVYGSYADGTNDSYSDFDCLLIVKSKDRMHDDMIIDGVLLDCFLYSEQEMEQENIETFLPLYEAKLVYDTGMGQAVQSRVRNYVQSHTVHDPEEKRFLVSWIRKTMKRMEKTDEEGHFRAIAFLAESLEDYCILRDRFYFGSKKTIRYLKDKDEQGFRFFQKAITARSNETIREWAKYILQVHRLSASAK